MAKAKQHTLKLTDNQLHQLVRLVGNHTDADTCGTLYGKLCTLYKANGLDYRDAMPGTVGFDANGPDYAGTINLD